MNGSPEFPMCEDAHIVNPIISTELKKCSRCKKIKLISSFYIDKSKKCNLSSRCKICIIESSTNWRKKNPEKRRSIVKKWDDNNKYKKKIYTKYYQKNNSKKLAEKSKNWRKNNLQRAREVMNSYCKRKRNTLKGKLSMNMKSSIYRSLKGNKNNHWENLVGYTVNQLKEHLEKKFLSGMSWDNYGKWHIDHIIPISVFNFKSSDDIDFKRCWALSNLQPLWAFDNVSKKDKLIKPFQPSLALG
jgi:hypothetical protein